MSGLESNVPVEAITDSVVASIELVPAPSETEIENQETVSLVRDTPAGTFLSQDVFRSALRSDRMNVLWTGRERDGFVVHRMQGASTGTIRDNNIRSITDTARTKLQWTTIQQWYVGLSIDVGPRLGSFIIPAVGELTTEEFWEDYQQNQTFDGVKHRVYRYWKLPSATSIPNNVRVEQDGPYHGILTVSVEPPQFEEVTFPSPHDATVFEITTLRDAFQPYWQPFARLAVKGAGYNLQYPGGPWPDECNLENVVALLVFESDFAGPEIAARTAEVATLYDRGEISPLELVTTLRELVMRTMYDEYCEDTDFSSKYVPAKQGLNSLYVKLSAVGSTPVLSGAKLDAATAQSTNTSMSMGVSVACTAAISTSAQPSVVSVPLSAAIGAAAGDVAPAVVEARIFVGHIMIGAQLANLSAQEERVLMAEHGESIVSAFAHLTGPVAHHVSLASVGSVDIVVVDAPAMLSAYTQLLPIVLSVGATGMVVIFSEEAPNPAIELDDEARCAAAVTTTGAKPNLQLVVSVSTAVVATLPEDVIDKLVQSTRQCHGYTATERRRCKNRRRMSGSGTGVVWCNHHAYQSVEFHAAVAGTTGDYPEWWMSA